MSRLAEPMGRRAMTLVRESLSQAWLQAAGRPWRAFSLLVSLVVGAVPVILTDGLFRAARVEALDVLEREGPPSGYLTILPDARTLSDAEREQVMRQPDVTAVIRSARRTIVLPDSRGVPVTAQLVGRDPGGDILAQQRIVQGRTFTALESVRAERVGIANDAFLRRFARGSTLPATVWYAGQSWAIVGRVAPTSSVSYVSNEPELIVPWGTFAALSKGVVTGGTLTVAAPSEAKGHAAAFNTLGATRGVMEAPRVLRALALGSAAESQERTHRLLVAAGAVLSLVGLVVAVLSLSSVLLVTVQERRREIGLRRALGATRGMVAGQILAESLMLVLVGGASAVVIAAGLATSPLLTPEFGPPAVVLAPLATQVWALGLGALAVAVPASLRPALLAARVDPATALRHE